MTRTLAQAIRACWQGWLDAPVDATVFGTDDADAIAGLLDAVARDHLGAGIVDCLGYYASVGCTALVRLADDREVAIKAFQPHTTTAFLTAVIAVQRHLHLAGYPAAEPLAGPLAIGGTHATIDALLVDPGPIARPGAAVRRTCAAGLSRLVASTRSLVGTEAVAGLTEHPMTVRDDALWGRPHSPQFDFDAPSPAVAEIDALGWAAKRARDADRADLVIAHCDWTMRNLRVEPDPPIGSDETREEIEPIALEDRPVRLAAVFDWDSLALVAETQAVGQAAQTWRATGEHRAPPWPDAAEVASFVADYERARGRPFTRSQRRAIGGAALYNIAYTARCEAALQARWPDHDGHPHQALDLLFADGDRLLSL